MLSKILAASALCLASLSFSTLPAAPFSLEKDLESPLPTTLAAIDSEIQLLEAKLQNYRKDAFKKEMHAQPYMLDNWHQFAKEIGQHEDDEQNIFAIKERLKQLYERKAALRPTVPPQ